MADLNRIMLILAEKNRTGGGLLMNQARHHVQSASDVKMPSNLMLMCRRCVKL